eukprot:gnl/Dysnectes_brevis/2541_a3059_851.p1 GENE.gnl/Dysnectes_brevis/2541_a3059_851~~gnl/Dysnectes_brevis/2541_a3059_851.p1  ORF type:complete len:381 (-),score=112.32 gnl/Dysnectes_brevis/2541_a3059_851:30-1172(-)
MNLNEDDLFQSESERDPEPIEEVDEKKKSTALTLSDLIQEGRHKRSHGTSLIQESKRTLDSLTKSAPLPGTDSSVPEWAQLAINQHASQSYFVSNGKHPQLLKLEDHERTIIPGHSKTRAYHRRQGEVKSVVGWQERGLFLLAMEFLTPTEPGPCHVTGLSNRCVSFLAKCFPTHAFTFERFGRSQEATLPENLQEGEAAPHSLLLLLAPYSRGERLREDLQAVQQEYRRVAPLAGLLRLSLPWDRKHVRWLAGEARRPLFGRPTDTDVFVYVTGDGSQEAEWDSGFFEDAMFHHNTVSRVSLYNHGLPTAGACGLDHCYDCTGEVRILRAYRGEPDAQVVKHSKALSACLSMSRTLVNEQRPAYQSPHRSRSHSRQGYK